MWIQHHDSSAPSNPRPVLISIPFGLDTIIHGTICILSTIMLPGACCKVSDMSTTIIQTIKITVSHYSLCREQRAYVEALIHSIVHGRIVFLNADDCRGNINKLFSPAHQVSLCITLIILWCHRPNRSPLSHRS